MEKNLVIEATAIPVEVEFADVEAMEETFAAGSCTGCSSVSN
jgi:hypothetical protein